MKKGWKIFLEKLPYEYELLHKDEFEEKYGKHGALPAVFLYEDKLKEIVTAKEMNSCETLGDLKSLVKKKINLQK